MSNKDRLHFAHFAKDPLTSYTAVEIWLDASSLSPRLRHLVKLLASQINGCAYCFEMHNREARKDGEEQTRLDHLVIWRDAGCFSEAERAAFAWTEALTRIAGARELDRLHTALASHFSDEEIAALTAQIANINVWNRLQVAAHGRAAETARAA